MCGSDWAIVDNLLIFWRKLTAGALFLNFKRSNVFNCYVTILSSKNYRPSSCHFFFHLLVDRISSWTFEVANLARSDPHPIDPISEAAHKFGAGRCRRISF